MKRLILWTGLLIFLVIVGMFGLNWLLRGRNQIMIRQLDGATEQTWQVDAQVVRVAVYNIAHGSQGQPQGRFWQGGDKQTKIERITAIAELLAEHSADLIILNEIDFSAFWSGGTNQAELIAQVADYPYWVEQRNFDVAIPFLRVQDGNAVLSKHPIVSAEFIDLPAYNTLQDIVIGSKNSALVTIALPDGSEIVVIPVHLEVRSEQTRVECRSGDPCGTAETILELVANSEHPLIVAGDFNSTYTDFPDQRFSDTGENAMEHFLDSGHLSSHLAPDQFTYSARNPRRVIDWVVFTEQWQLQEQYIVETLLSDHLPLITTLSFNK